METFWPTVGTVLSLGSGLSGWKRALTCSWNVVLPALSRPRRMTEYSEGGRVSGGSWGWDWWGEEQEAYPPCWWLAGRGPLRDDTLWARGGRGRKLEMSWLMFIETAMADPPDSTIAWAQAGAGVSTPLGSLSERGVVLNCGCQED